LNNGNGYSFPRYQLESLRNKRASRAWSVHRLDMTDPTPPDRPGVLNCYIELLALPGPVSSVGMAGAKREDKDFEGIIT